jgi:hypothetical protein
MRSRCGIREKRYVRFFCLNSNPNDFLGVVDIRWSADRPEIGISEDGSVAEIGRDIRDPSALEVVDGRNYIRIQADQPLNETIDTWTIQYVFNGGSSSHAFRIGIVDGDDRFLTPRLQFIWTGQLRALDNSTEIWSIPALPNETRFTVSADLRSGRLSVRLDGGAGRSAFDLFDIYVPPAVMAESFPAVFMYGVGSRVQLLKTI